MISLELRNHILGGLFVLSLCLTSFFSHELHAQISHSIEQQQKALDLLNELQSATLVVVLKSNKNKLDHLQQQLSGEGLSRSQRKRYQKIYDKELNQRNKMLDSLSLAIAEDYTFSDVLLINDYDLDEMRNGRNDLFLDEYRKPDTAIRLDTSRSIFYLMERYTEDTESSRVYALVILDKNLKPLHAPFPYYVKLTRFGPVPVFQLIINKSEYRPIRRVVNRLQYKLVNHKEILETTLQEIDK